MLSTRHRRAQVKIVALRYKRKTMLSTRHGRAQVKNENLN